MSRAQLRLMCPYMFAAVGGVHEGAALLHCHGVHVPGQHAGVPPPRQQVRQQVRIKEIISVPNPKGQISDDVAKNLILLVDLDLL